MPTNRKQSVFAEDSTLLDTAFLPFLDLLQPVLDDRNRKISYLNFKTQLLAALGASPVIITPTLWVDNTPGQGDDGTATRGDINKKYATIGAALTDAQDGDTVYVIYSGTDYVENLTKTIANTSNFSIVGIGAQRPTITSTGVTLAMTNGFWSLRNLVIESTSATSTDSVFEITGSNFEAELIDCDFLANGNSRILASNLNARNCYFLSAGNNFLYSGQNSQFYKSYFKQPDTATQLCISTDTRIYMDTCWVDGGTIGITGGGGFSGTMTIKNTNFLNSPKNISTRRDMFLVDCTFISTSTFANVELGYNVSTISSIIGCLFHNTSTATIAVTNNNVGATPNINTSGNFYSQVNFSNTPLLEIGNNYNSPNMAITGTDSIEALGYFNNRA